MIGLISRDARSLDLDCSSHSPHMISVLEDVIFRRAADLEAQGCRDATKVHSCFFVQTPD